MIGGGRGSEGHRRLRLDVEGVLVRGVVVDVVEGEVVVEAHLLPHVLLH